MRVQGRRAPGGDVSTSYRCDGKNEEGENRRRNYVSFQRTTSFGSAHLKDPTLLAPKRLLRL